MPWTRQRRTVPLQEVSAAGLRPEVRLQDNGPQQVSPHVTSPFHVFGVSGRGRGG